MLDFQVTKGNQPQKVFAKPDTGHVSLGWPLRALAFFVVFIPGAALLAFLVGVKPPILPIVLVVFAFIVALFVNGIRVAAQWERGIVLRLGRFLGIRGPGVVYVIPIIDNIRFVDTRTLVLNVPKQKVITKDNVPAEVDGALFFLVTDPEKAVIHIQDYRFAMAQYAQAALRDVVGGLSLDELLTERERIQAHIGEIVEERVSQWGLHVDTIRLLDIELPEDLKRMMSRQASAEREKRATITKAEGDKLAAFNLAEAAATMLKSPGAMQLRTLQTVDGLGPSASNTVVLYPVDLTGAIKTLGELAKPAPQPPA